MLIGDPINFDDILEFDMEKGSNVPRRRLFDAVASRIGDRLHEMKVQVDTIAIDQEMQLQDKSSHSTERTSKILQQVDWELFGMDSFMSVEDDSKQRQETVALSNVSVSQHHQQSHSDQSWRAGFSYRMRGYIDQMELVSFAARGIFLNNDTKNSARPSREMGPLKAWKQFLEANLLRQWNYVHY